jgi:G:T-mismatch repair DNA endonuclease (very short patch repair protein)
MLSAGLSINVIRDGRKIFVVEIKDLSIQFVRSNNYFNGDEFYLATMFEIPNKRMFFPFRFKDFGESCTIPNIGLFIDFKDSEEIRQEKINFVNDLKQKNLKWIFDKELIIFAEEKTRLLTTAFLKFIEESFNFQNLLKNEENQKDFIIHPIATNICTISAFIFKVFRLFYLNKYPVFSIKNEYGLSCRHTSAQEYEFSKYYEFKYPEKKFRSIFSHKLGQKVFKQGVMPDLYSEDFGEIINYNGCWFHCHTPCLINKNATPQTKHPVFNKTFEEVNIQFDQKMASLLDNNNEIKSINIVWECQYLQMRKNPEFQNFLKNHFKTRPLYRLSVRESIRGGITDCYALKWLQNENLNESFYCLDMNGMYPWVSLKYKFFFGKYDILIGKDIEKIVFKNNEFFYSDIPEPLDGLMQITILPPKNLFYPFLPIKLKNNKTVFTLCFQCAENQSKKCTHCDKERALTSVYYISEIKFALGLGYKVMEIYECYYFEKCDFLLKNLVQKLTFMRLQNSEIFKDCTSNDERIEYCKYLNDAMDLKPPFSLTPDNVQPNKEKKQFYKVLICSLFGKLEQRSDKPKTIYVNSQSELEDVYFSDSEILNIFCINDQTCELEIKPKLDKILPNRETNVAIGGQLVAYARQLMYETILQVDRTGKLFYVDCDSCFFSMPKNQSIPLLISDSFGQFKQVYDGNITSFFCLGPKNYCISYETENNKIKTVTKMKGFSLSSFYVKNEMNSATFDYFITKSLSEEIEKKDIAQIKFNKRDKTKNSVPKLQLLKCSNNLTSRRIVMKKCKYLTTFPYGNENV